MKRIITISGTPGSGKSTIAKALCQKFKAKRVYVGQYMRTLARKKNMTLAELNKLAQSDPNIDIQADQNTAKKARRLAKKYPVVVEGRVQFYFLPESTKLFIKANASESAKRIWQDLQDAKKNKQRNEAKVKNIDDLKKEIIIRKKSELLRYKKYYKLNHYLPKHYDFILDTSHINAEQAISKTLDFLKKKPK
jgi:cytidylate kinase